MSTATQTPLEFHAEMRRHAQRRFRRRAAVIVVAFAVVVMLAIWANSVAQRYFILGDDAARGERFRELLTPIGATPDARESYVVDQCRTAAEAFYGNSIADDDPPELVRDGHAAPNEKAFFHACSGWTVGGRGGGGGD